MAATQDSTADSNVSDFDNSDEDLASLLNDEDEDEFAKKMFGNSTVKASTQKVFSSAATTSKVPTKIVSPHHSSAKVTNKSKISSDDEFGDDVLDEFVETNINKTVATNFKQSAPEKSKVKRSSFQTEGTDSLENLSQFSPSKDLSNKSPIKKSNTGNKNSGILDDLNTRKVNSKPPEERRGSVFDDFLQKLSPKHGSKIAATSDLSEEKLKDNNDSEEDILSAYIPTAPKKNDNSSDGTLKSPNRRGSLLKQVSFKDPSDDFYETDLPVTNAVVSPEKSSAKKTLPKSPQNESPVRIRRSEKAGSNKKDDIDWLNFFKDSPKKIPKSQEEKASDNLKKTDPNVKSKAKPSMTRQSSADWLGLSDSKGLDEINGDKDELTQNIKIANIDKTNFMPTEPKTTSAPVIRPRRQEISKTVDEWTDERDFIKNISQPVTSDLSLVLKDTDIKLPFKKKHTATFLNDSFEPEKIDPFSASKSKRDSKVVSEDQMVGDNALSNTFISDNIVTSKDCVMKEQYTIPARDLHENRDYAATLQSLKLMLDDSIKERNKLLKENESIKLTLEEKLRASEEFNKSEKKMLEDSFKTLESSLKKEFEIKIKSLEERLHLITEEKEKQAKHFEEKINNILGEHHLEMQRLKELHSESINIMKKDHEDALLRLKRLKEQEIEAVLSTQVHSKSLQYLTDQLETRANELASLQNKIEERSQTMLREKELLLDAKEKDLKALQKRLEKQLENSDDERTRLQQLVLRLEGRLHKLTMEGEENHWEAQQLKAKLTVKEKYLEEEQKLNQYQLEKEKEKLKLSQDSLLHEQKIVLLQLAQERQQLTQEKIDLQSLAKNIKEEESKLNVKKLKEESSIETEKQYLFEEKNKIHFEKEKIKQEVYQLEREHDSVLKEKQQIKKEKENLHEQEMNLNRKSLEIEEMAAVAALEKERGQREHAEALAIKKEHQLKMQQYNQQMQMLMDKERYILSEREKLVTEKLEFEQNKSSVLCTKCKVSLENPVQVVPPPSSDISAVIPLENRNGFSSQVQQSFVDPNLVIWHITAQKDQEFLQQELAFLQSLKNASKRKSSK